MGKQSEYKSKKYGKDKTMAAVEVNGEVKYTLSGYSDNISNQAKKDFGDDRSKYTKAVLENQKNIGYECKPNKANDHNNKPGIANASHAEKQGSAMVTNCFDVKNTTTNINIGVTKPMCKDCQNYFTALSKNGYTCTVVDPKHVRIFKDGVVNVIPIDKLDDLF